MFVDMTTFAFQESPPLVRIAPLVAGAITWSRNLMKRIEDPMKIFKENKFVTTYRVNSLYFFLKAIRDPAGNNRKNLEKEINPLVEKNTSDSVRTGSGKLKNSGNPKNFMESVKKVWKIEQASLKSLETKEMSGKN